MGAQPAAHGERHDRRGLVWQMAGGYLSALCYGSPRQVLFSALLEWARSSRTRPLGIVIEDRRHGLGAVRLGGMALISRELGAPLVLLTGSPLARLAARVARWRGAAVYVASPDALDEALDRLGVGEAERAQVLAAIRALRVARALGKSRRRRSSDHSSQTPLPVN